MTHRAIWGMIAGAAVLSACATGPAAPNASPAIDAEAAMLYAFPQAPVSPPLPTAALTRLVIGSCSHQEFNRDQTVFQRMAARKADLAILMGDNVYGSNTPDDPLLSGLRAAYVGQAARRDFQALVSTTPTLAVWDDHDFGKNDGGGEDFPQRALAQKMFDAFWRVGPDDPRAHDQGVYGSWVIGPAGQRVQIIMLDTRYWRSPLKPTDQRDVAGKERYLEDATPTKTVLGEKQWKWLEGELKKPAELRLVVSSIQISADGHGWEKFGNFPHERARFFELVGRTGAKGVVVLSGDRHYTSINRAGAEKAGYPIYDFTSSAVNMPWSLPASEKLPTLVTEGYSKENFGAIAIDWAGKSLTLEARDKDDKPIFSRTIPFAEIGAG